MSGIRLHIGDQVVDAEIDDGDLAELTRVNSEICPICHMDKRPGCKSGSIGLDPETRDIQLDPEGVTSSYVACPQKLDWYNTYKPMADVSVPENERKKVR